MPKQEAARLKDLVRGLYEERERSPFVGDIKHSVATDYASPYKYGGVGFDPVSQAFVTLTAPTDAQVFNMSEVMTGAGGGGG